MNPFQRSQFRRILRQRLQDFSGAEHLIKRRRLDGNGQPTGEPETIGALFGVAYRKNQTSAGLVIDLPGIVATSDNTRHFAAVASDTVIPQEGDLIEIDGQDVVIMRNNVPPGDILFDLMLKD